MPAFEIVTAPPPTSAGASYVLDHQGTSVELLPVPRELDPDLGTLGAGAVYAIVLGFVPANFIASVREDSAFAAIDATVVAAQLQADTPETYAALDSFRDAKLSEKNSTRRMIALTSMLLWAAASGGLADVWFRRIPWHRVGNRST